MAKKVRTDLIFSRSRSRGHYYRINDTWSETLADYLKKCFKNQQRYLLANKSLIFKTMYSLNYQLKVIFFAGST